MSKKSFSEIEQAIKKAAEAHEPAFDEQAWKKMEALLDKEKDRKRPFIFWLWWMIPLLMGAGVIGYFSMNENNNKTKPAYQKKPAQALDKTNEIADVPDNSSGEPALSDGTQNTGGDVQPITGNKGIKDAKTGAGKTAGNENKLTLSDVTQNTGGDFPPVTGNKGTRDAKKGVRKTTGNENNSYENKMYSPDDVSKQNTKEEISATAKPNGKIKGKTNVKITAASPESDPENGDPAMDKSVSSNSGNSKAPEKITVTEDTASRLEETVVIKVETNKQDDKEIEKIVDSVISKKVSDKKTKEKISKIYVIVAAGAEASGVKLFSADKVTPRYGAAVGFQINKKISVQAGFFASNKKYIAGKDDYKAKPGSYWAVVDIKSIDGNCRVYEIPVQVRYDFTSGKKLGFFATAGLSTYLMKKEHYTMHYVRYGTYNKVEVDYSGNNSFFSVLRISAGAEKKISDRFALFASPGIAVPLAGVGEGEVKLYSTDIILGLKYTPKRKKN